MTYQRFVGSSDINRVNGIELMELMDEERARKGFLKAVKLSVGGLCTLRDVLLPF